MRFVVDQHKKVEHLPNNPALPRHCQTLKRGIELMKVYTNKACRASPELAAAFKRGQEPILPTPPQTEEENPPEKIIDPLPKPERPRRETKPKPVRFPTTRFVCVAANSVAQVWLCVKHKGEVSIGRRTGKAPKGDSLPHKKGECAVLRGDLPLVDSDTNDALVFATRQQAEAKMQELYNATPGDEKMTDNNHPDFRTTTVYANETHSVHFDPDYNGTLMPFNIYDIQNQKMYMDARKDQPLKFKTITGAITKADELDKQYRGAY